MSAPDDRLSLEGTVERIVYKHPESGFTVIRFASKERGSVTAVGHLYGIQEGEMLRLEGRFERDRKFGEQLKVETHLQLKPQTLAGIERYLGSGLVEGIGKSLAERLVAKFGLETLDVIEAHPERLTEVDGIGRVRAGRLTEAWAAQRGVREVMIFLESHGISPAFAARIFRRFGVRALEIVRADPYRLALEVPGIGFKMADKVGASIGLDKRAPARARAGVLHALGEASSEGHVRLPKGELIERAATLLEIEASLVEQALFGLIDAGGLAAEGGASEPIYLPPLLQAEKTSAQVLRSLLSVPPRALGPAVDRLAQHEQATGLTLAPAQRQAILQALERPLSVITGGPGTGKTTLVRGLLHLAIAGGRRVRLAAPTGRAAKRLSEATGQPASTLHRLLEVDPKGQAFLRDAANPLELDMLIVDEVSMIDIALFAAVLIAMPLKSQLVLVGDADQLPSVGPGNVLADLIGSGVVPVVRLERIYRQAGASLITENAHRINRGEMPELEQKAGDALSDFYVIDRDDPEEALATLKTVISERVPKRFNLDPVDDVQVLTPMHRGVLGASRLNSELQALLNPGGIFLDRGHEQLRVGDKVMQTKNDYELNVFNGDLGRIQSIDSENRAMKVAFDDRLVDYQSADLDSLQLAYACSIHKSQGSEYPAVVILLHTQHYVMLHRRLLYTAVTRGRRLVVVIGNRRALKMAVENRRDVPRHSGLSERLR